MIKPAAPPEVSAWLLKYGWSAVGQEGDHEPVPSTGCVPTKYFYSSVYSPIKKNVYKPCLNWKAIWDSSL